MKNIKSLTNCCLLLVLLLSGHLIAQSDYYWADGEKIFLTEDRYRAAITFNTQQEALAFTDYARDGVSMEVHEFKPRIIVEFETPAQDKADVIQKLGIRSQGIRSVTFAQQLEDGMPIYFTHKVVAKLTAGVTLTDIEPILQQYGATHQKSAKIWQEFDVEDIDQVLPLANYLEESGLTAWATPDIYAKIETTNDPFYPQQFQMNNTGQSVGGRTGVNDIDCDAPEAWGISLGSSSVTVMVIDEGAESHPDVNITLPGYTPANNGNGTPTTSASAHGMACAGIIAANHNNIGVRGLAPNVRVRGVNIFASGTSATDIGDGFVWSADNGADIISNSWGYNSCTFSSSTITSGIQYAVNNGRSGRGCVVIFSAGNSNRNCVNYPGNRQEVIAVSAMGNRGARSTYSSFGPATDISAPSSYGGSGGRVYTTDRQGAPGYTSGDYYSGFGGTSAACPLVSGAAALVLSVNSTLTEAQVKTILYNSATDMGAAGRDDIYGHGRVNAHQAVLQASGGGGGPSCSSTVTSYPYTNTFESNLGWSQATGDDFNWTRRSGGTPSVGTGPSGAAQGSFYAYMEVSSPNFPSKTAILNSPCFNLSSVSSPTFTFRYHMLGGTSGNPGTLRLEASTNGTSWTQIWSRTGNQGSNWLSASVSLNSYANATQLRLRFRGTSGSGASDWQGDICVDDFRVAAGGGGGNGCSSTVSSFPYSNTFDSNLGWSQATGDDFNWTRRTGGTPSSGTGPSGAAQGSHYAYMEVSSPNFPSKTAILNSPCFNLSSVSSPTFTFRYHMLGGTSGNPGTLRLEASTNGTSWTQLWSRSGNQGSSWQSASVSLNSYTSSTTLRLRFRGTSGSGVSDWQGDMCVDDLRVAGGSGGGGTNTVQVQARTRGSNGSARMRVRRMSGTNYQGTNTTLETRTYTVGSSWTTYTVTFSANVTASRLRVYFDNDASNRDLEVDWVRVGSTTFQSEASDTWATGTWTSNGGCNDAFKQSQMIHCNGYFHYDANNNAAPNLDDTSFDLQPVAEIPYPNPFSAELNIPVPEALEVGAEVQVQLITLHGQKVFEATLAYDGTSLSILPKVAEGLYVLQIKSGEFKQISKVMKE
ncbi:MAG: S8 family serine peptidase [Bacteroidota bacterium]